MKKLFLVFIVLTAMCLTIGCNKKTTEAVQPEKIEQTEKAIIIEGLQWSEKSPKTMNWNDAINYCKNLNEDGHNDWRLPTISELKTTIKNCRSGSSLCRMSDSCLSSGCYSYNCYCTKTSNNGGYYSKLGDDENVTLWSSSVLSDDSNFAAVVDFSKADVLGSYMASASPDDYVRCVRNLQHSGSNKTATNAESTKEEKVEEIEEEKKVSRAKKSEKTEKLQWSNKTATAKKWNEAKLHCEMLNESDPNDWRLPNIDELRTLIQNHSGTQSGGSCPISEKAGKLAWSDRTSDCEGRSGSNFSKLDDGEYFWSSSVTSNRSDSAWRVNFYNGEIYPGRHIDYGGDVRCVRNKK